jgi:aconitate hydratase
MEDLSILDIDMPEEFDVNDNMVAPPAQDGSKVEVVRGPNIKPFPINEELPDELEAKALLKMEDNITQTHIMPSNASLLPYRSNVPHLANYCLTPVDETFPARARREERAYWSRGIITDRDHRGNMRPLLRCSWG